MSEWKAKRFWTTAEVVAVPGGFSVQLDGRVVKTPAKAPLVLPSESLAREVADEWNAQQENIDPTTMPFTRSANAAIDKVAVQFNEVAELIAAYGDSDLLCYRATEPDELVARQAAGWDPILDWARESQNIDLKTISGVVHQTQAPETLAEIARKTRSFTVFELTAFHDLVGLSGSFLLGLAVTEEFAVPDAIWALSRLDETWQEEQWGVDQEAADAAEIKRTAFLCAAKFFSLVANGC